jgi:hypothetical protein
MYMALYGNLAPIYKHQMFRMVTYKGIEFYDFRRREELRTWIT